MLEYTVVKKPVYGICWLVPVRKFQIVLQSYNCGETKQRYWENQQKKITGRIRFM